MNDQVYKLKTSLDIKNGLIDLNFGAGGKQMLQLIEGMFVRAFDNEYLNQRNDQAMLGDIKGRIVMSTDGHVVTPLIFPGGDIGKLSVCGTINDICMSGAKPLYLTTSFIIEEGFPLKSLQEIVISMAKTSKECNVPIVTGDTKVVEKGKAGDGIFVTTTGIGTVLDSRLNISLSNAKAGDKIIISGDIGDHGIAIMSKRENLDFETEIKSDVAALHDLVRVIAEAAPNVHCLHDPTRGGVASALNEIAQLSNVSMLIDEATFPVKPAVRSACEFLGIDPLYVANEGKLIVICKDKDVKTILMFMRQHPLGKNSTIIGRVTEDKDHFVYMTTLFEGTRLLQWPSGEQLPRIC